MHQFVDSFSIRLNKDEILKGQGIDPAKASQRLSDIAESVIEEAQALLKPAAMFSVVKVNNFGHHSIAFEGGVFTGSLVGKAMAGADHLIISVCTIGSDLEKRVDEIMNENPVLAIALDGAGISGLRKVSQAVEDMICAEACELELSLGMRAQPGQEGWPIEQQRVVFKLMPAEKIGVQLTESCLMLPRKSVSFVIPRGKNLDNSVAPCDFCSKRIRCEWRKEKQTG